LKLIRKAVRKNKFFDQMDADDLDKFVSKFEHIEVGMDSKIVTQGETADFFYIVGEDSIVSFEVDGVKIGEAEDGGSFGGISMVYSCPRAASVVAKSSPTDLFRVSRDTFKSFFGEQIKSKEAQKMRHLKAVDFLSEMSEFDRMTLGHAMTPFIFKRGNVIVKKKDEIDALHLVIEGRLKIKEMTVGGTKLDDTITLKRGDYFGERALAINEPTFANVVAASDGFGFRIDRRTFEGVLGDYKRVIMKAQDRKILEGIQIFESCQLTEQQFEELANLVVDENFKCHEKIFSNGRSTNAALYLVREGTVSLTGQRSDWIKPGAYFGEELLLLDTKRDQETVKGAPTKAPARYTAVAKEDCMCGVLSLSDCRTIFETSKMMDSNAGDGLEVLTEETSTDDETEEQESTSERVPRTSSRNSKSKFVGRQSSGPSRNSSSQWLSKLSKHGLRQAVKENLKLESLKKHEVLGTGQFGEVYLVSAFVSPEYGKQLFALKTQMKNDSVRGDSVAAIKREVELLALLDHPYIVNLVHWYENSVEMHILMGAVYGGELFDVIHTQNRDGTWSSGLPESDAKFYAMVIVDTLDYIHRKQFVYRDLKPENVLIDEDGYPIICDFGFAKFVTDKTYTLCGTPNYLSPEIIMNSGHNASTDHWALGILIYEMVAGENPFYYDGISQMDLLQSICQENFYPLPNSVSDEAFYVVDGLLRKDPTLRLGSTARRGKDIMAKKWFSELVLDDLRQKKHTAPYIPDNETMDHLKVEALTRSDSDPSVISSADFKRLSGRSNRESGRESGYRSSFYNNMA